MLKEEIKKATDLIDGELKKVLNNKIEDYKILFEAINYSLFTGGKRLRPILLVKSFEIFSDQVKEALPFAIAIEMIHTYSLIHDDLPSMDDDDFRRGKPSNHKVYGEAMAILSGNGLLNLAFETMSKHTLERSKTLEDYRKNIRAMEEISTYSGIYGMIGGQVLDLMASSSKTSEDQIIFMYENKTAALIQAALVAGAILGGARDTEVEKIRKFGYNLGLAYQIKDDILDKKEDKESNKLTYTTYLGVEAANTKVEELSKEAIEILNGLENRDTRFLKEITDFLIHRNY